MNDDELTLALVLYNKIMFAENEDQLVDLTGEVQRSILKRKLDDIESMMLNLALQVKANYFLIKTQELLSQEGMTVIFAGASDMFDPEEEQLKEMLEEELDEVKSGKILSIVDFDNGDKDD